MSRGGAVVDDERTNISANELSGYQFMSLSVLDTVPLLKTYAHALKKQLDQVEGKIRKLGGRSGVEIPATRTPSTEARTGVSAVEERVLQTNTFSSNNTTTNDINNESASQAKQQQKQQRIRPWGSVSQATRSKQIKPMLSDGASSSVQTQQTHMFDSKQESIDSQEQRQ